MEKKIRLSDEQLSRALGEHCGPGLDVAGTSAWDDVRKPCVFQAALNDLQFTFWDIPPEWVGAFDVEYRFGWSPDRLLRHLERWGAA